MGVVSNYREGRGLEIRDKEGVSCKVFLNLLLNFVLNVGV